MGRERERERESEGEEEKVVCWLTNFFVIVVVVDAAYRSDEGLPWVLPVVRNVEMTMAADETLNHEYLAIDGLSQYSKAASCLLLGEESEAVLQDRVGLSPHI